MSPGLKLKKRQHTLLQPVLRLNIRYLRVISRYGREVDENFPVLGTYAASCVNSLQTFRDNLSVSSSRVEIEL